MYTLIRSSRKTIALKVLKDGTLQVKAPRQVSQSEIERFIEEKSDWIAKRTAQVKSAEDFEISDGSWIRVLGVDIPVLAVPDGRFEFKRAVKLDHSVITIPAGADPKTVKRGIVNIYRKLAEDIILQRAAWYEAVMDLHPTKVRINNAASRWGSCSSKKSINFSWRLVMADGKAIDSVVIHELAHIKYMNHSKAFWNLVEQYCPDYKIQRKKLNRLSEKLMAENWDV